jgi:lipopolysaccharide/colanic/teichoic acid biosynthesis glycosyltransferase
MERPFDLLFSSIALIFLFPLFLIVSLILVFTGEHKIFYLQQRIGRNGKLFNLIKFATMLENSPNIGTGEVTLKNDPRVLPVGRLLRKTKINELPQVINIFLGDMSIIGPRPLTPKIYNLYNEYVKNQISRVRPGLSGIGSIIFRDEEDLIFKSGMDANTFYKEKISLYKGELEIWYIRKRTIGLYFFLIILTVVAVISPRPISVFSIFKDLPVPPFGLFSGDK